MATTHTTTHATLGSAQHRGLGRYGRLAAAALALGASTAGVAIGLSAISSGGADHPTPATSSALLDGAAFADAVDQQLGAKTSALLDEDQFRAIVDEQIRSFEPERSALLDGAAFDRLLEEQLRQEHR